jgi:putative spermidine/putrescine transport system permease protein
MERDDHVARMSARMSESVAPRPPRTPARPAWTWAAYVALALSTLLPLVVLVLQSLATGWRWPAVLPDGFTAAGWRAASEGALGRAAVTSALLAAATATASVLVALPIGRSLATLRAPWRHVAAALVFLPVAAPPIALGAGLQVATLQLGLGGSAVGVWLAHCVPAVGYAALLFMGVFGARGRDDEEAARSLGASRAQVWWHVLLPSVRGVIVEALAIGFLISWAQVALTLLIGGGAVRALPIEVLALVRAGQDRDAAVGALLLVVPAMLALSALRFGARRTDALPA